MLLGAPPPPLGLRAPVFPPPSSTFAKAPPELWPRAHKRRPPPLGLAVQSGSQAQPLTAAASEGVAPSSTWGPARVSPRASVGGVCSLAQKATVRSPARAEPSACDLRTPLASTGHLDAHGACLQPPASPCPWTSQASSVSQSCLIGPTSAQRRPSLEGKRLDGFGPSMVNFGLNLDTRRHVSAMIGPSSTNHIRL